MFNQSKISFRRLDFADLPLLHKWLNMPHVHEWYDKHDINSLERVTKDYGDQITGKEPIDSYMVLYEEKPVAYIQSYKVIDWPEFMAAVGPDEHAAGVDLFIGEKDFIGKGLGALMLTKFLKEIVFVEKGITKCIIDPEPDNKRAIRVYEKIGFKYVKTVQIPGEPELTYLMEIRKEDSQN